LANGYARVISSYGPSVTLNIHLPEFSRVTGRIVAGEPRFQLPIRNRPMLAYRVAGGTLQGAGKEGGRISLTRVAEVLPVPVHTAYFLPVGPAAPALHALKGILTIKAPTMFRARYGCAGVAEPLLGFSVAFFTHGEHLVPVVSDLAPFTSIILSPGRMWSEPGDGGMSRASFPFVVTNPYFNDTHNGLATFLYDDTRVSTIRLQVVQETASDLKYDGWSQVTLTYVPGPHRD
jgi:hypothetical protein